MRRMDHHDPIEFRALLDRILRICAAEDWTDDISPAQRAVLTYLGRANRFSRAPSQIADYLNATRGTISQTLKTLARKGLVTETRSDRDKRSISYEIAQKGQSILERDSTIESVFKSMPEENAETLSRLLRDVIAAVLKEHGGRSFGICRSCQYHLTGSGGARCALLDEPLSKLEANEICHEHTPGPAK